MLVVQVMCIIKHSSSIAFEVKSISAATRLYISDFNSGAPKEVHTTSESLTLSPKFRIKLLSDFHS